MIKNANDLVRLLDAAGYDTEQFTVEYYEFHDEIGVATYFNATGLREYIEARPQEFPAILIQITPELVEAVQRKGVEDWKLARLAEWLMRNGLKEKMRPIIICKCHDGSHICVDGAHRVTMFNDLGASSIPGVILQPDVWKQFAFDNMEELTAQALSKFADNLDG